MNCKDCTTKRTTHMLKWINQYSGWWYLICTPGDEHMTLKMMQTLIVKLHEAALDELIFVMLMVHREEKYMESFFPVSLLDRLIDRWGSDHEQIVNEWVAHFE